MTDASDRSPASVAHPTTPEEKEDLAELRAAIHPDQTLRSLEDFAKWLFAISAVVGSLGGAFGISGIGNLAGAGRWLFALAVSFLGVSLAAAVVATVPYRVDVNRWSLESLNEAFGRIVTFRRRVLVLAAGSFALSLILAGLAPVFS